MCWACRVQRAQSALAPAPAQIRRAAGEGAVGCGAEARQQLGQVVLAAAHGCPAQLPAQPHPPSSSKAVRRGQLERILRCSTRMLDGVAALRGSEHTFANSLGAMAENDWIAAEWAGAVGFLSHMSDSKS